MGGTKKSSDVPQQFYGYSIQLPRMAVHLLDAEPGAHVCLEHIDDVAVLGPSADVTLEQSKSSSTDNPVSDRALAFWKTASNWIDVVRQGRVKAESTQFRLHVAQNRECGPLVAMLRDASTDGEIRAAVDAARTAFWGSPPHFPLRPNVPPSLARYIENIFSAGVEPFEAIVKKLKIDVGTGDSIDEVRRGVRKQLVSNDQVDSLVKHMLGWLQERVHASIEAGEVVIIARDEFFSAMLAWVRKYDRILQLSPWATEPPKDAIDQELERRLYVRQLDLIEADVDEKIGAAADYLKSIVDRTQWSARGDVAPSSFQEFEDNLHRQWKARFKALSLANPNLPHVILGQLLLANCQKYQSKLQNMEPSYYFTMGCFHSLADDLKVGWHPQYRDHLPAPATKKAS